MKLLEAVGEFFALDIGTTALNVVQLRRTSSGWTLEKAGSMPVDLKTTASDSPEFRHRLSEQVSQLISQTGITAKNVVVGIPSSKMFATVVNIPDVPASEMSAAIHYQAEQFVPMSLDEAKIDWAVLGKLPSDPTKNEVLLVAVENVFTEGRLDVLESIGLNVVAIEPDSVAIARALANNEANTSLIVRFGDNTTDIVIVSGGAPKLIRSLPLGLGTFIKAVQQSLSIDEAQAAQFVTKFGLVADKLEGRVARSLQSVVEQFISEVTKSVKFFDGKYPGVTIGEVVLTDVGLLVPGFKRYITEKTGLNVVDGNSWAKVSVSQADAQRLQDVAMTFAVAVGLAMRSEG